MVLPLSLILLLKSFNGKIRRLINPEMNSIENKKEDMKILFICHVTSHGEFLAIFFHRNLLNHHYKLFMIYQRKTLERSALLGNIVL